MKVVLGIITFYSVPIIISILTGSDIPMLLIPVFIFATWLWVVRLTKNEKNKIKNIIGLK